MRIFFVVKVLIMKQKKSKICKQFIKNFKCLLNFIVAKSFYRKTFNQKMNA